MLNFKNDLSIFQFAWYYLSFLGEVTEKNYWLDISAAWWCWLRRQTIAASWLKIKSMYNLEYFSLIQVFMFHYFHFTLFYSVQ